MRRNAKREGGFVKRLDENNNREFSEKKKETCIS